MKKQVYQFEGKLNYNTGTTEEFCGQIEVGREGYFSHGQFLDGKISPISGMLWKERELSRLCFADRKNGKANLFCDLVNDRDSDRQNGIRYFTGLFYNNQFEDHTIPLQMIKDKILFEKLIEVYGSVAGCIEMKLEPVNALVMGRVSDPSKCVIRNIYK